MSVKVVGFGWRSGTNPHLLADLGSVTFSVFHLILRVVVRMTEVGDRSQFINHSLLFF